MEIQRSMEKLQAKEDRISELPDHLIHHILSFLPSTKQVIQTGILSKRWRKQWIHVPVLIFDRSTCTSYEKFLNFVNNTLVHYDCSKIKKFHLQYPCSKEPDPHFHDKILFATQKQVQELYLDLAHQELLPKFLFNTASSLIKLTALRCTFMPNETVNWESLTTLHLRYCTLTNQALQHILSGTPLLESLELDNYSKFEKLLIVSKSLKRLVLRKKLFNILEISCPNLVELSIIDVFLRDPNVFAQAIDNTLSTSLSLESFELKDINCEELNQLVIASKSLKRLVLYLDDKILNIQVSCPQLQELEIRGRLRVRALKLLDLPSSLCATLDFYQRRKWKRKRKDEESSTNDTYKRLVEDIMHQLPHVKELIIGSSFIKLLAAFEVGGPVPFVLNIEKLTLNSPNLVYHSSAIACVLHNAPMLKKLVINMPRCDGDLKKFNDNRENFWNSNVTIFSCLLPKLRTIQIIGYPQGYDEGKLLVNFIQFLLKNATVLEKMVIILKDRQDNLPFRVSHQLLNLPRSSQYAIIELLYSK